MICPNCNAEYRQGFSHCADCDVDLVMEIPQGALASQPPSHPGDPNEDPFCSFWKGEDARVHAELCSVLDEAGIPHNTVFRRDHLFNLSNYPSYEVGVPFSLFEKAENTIKEAYGTEDVVDIEREELKRLLPERSNRIEKLPQMLMPPSERNIPGPPSAGQHIDWYPEDATALVWASTGGEPCDFLVAALHENRMHCRIAKISDRTELFVLPEDELRAREVVREVVEAQPPE
jgi:hypothetical protein